MVNKQLLGRFQIQLREHPKSMIATKEHYAYSKEDAFAIGDAFLHELEQADA